MNEHAVNALAQRAAQGISRRASLMTLVTTGLAAAIAAPFAAEAKKNRKKCKQKDKKCPSLKEICAPQVEDCTQVVAAVCGDAPACDHLLDCCEVFDECDVGQFVACIATPAPPPQTTPPR